VDLLVCSLGPSLAGSTAPIIVVPALRVLGCYGESASRPLVDFGVLNDKLIKGLISCIKCISRLLMKVQMYSFIHHLKYNYEANRTI
jgi:hypothetical protein